MTDKKTGMDALQRALKFEVEGRKYYLEAMEKTRNPIAKSLFETLAHEEERHMGFISELHAKLDAEGEWPKEATIDVQKDFKLIFAQARIELDKLVDVTTDELQAMTKAVEMESKGEKMYWELAEKADTPQEKNVYTILAQEEIRHREFADQYYHYFADRGLFTQD